MSSNPDAIIGNGAYFFPAITVYEIGHETKLGKPVGFCQRKIIVNKILDEKFRVLVTEDGFVCPIVDKNKDAVEFLNILFATFATKFHAAHYITTMDLASFGWEERTDIAEVNRARVLTSIRNNLESQRDYEHSFNDWSAIPRQEVLKQLMENLLEQAYRFYRNPEFKDDLLLIGESWGLSYGEMYTASFLYSWMIVEGFLERLWNEYVDSLKRSGKEKRALKNQHSWSVSHYIEVFHFIGQLDENGYKCLNTLRKIRNAIVHDRNKATQNEAWDCLEIAIYMVYNKLNQINSFTDVKLNKIKVEASL